MPSGYNRVAGQNVERVAALSDRIFALAMTLLPSSISAYRPARSGAFRAGLIALSPRRIIFLMSVMTLGIFWVGQQTHSNHFARADRNLGLDTHRLSRHRGARPLSTSLLAEFTHYRIALLVYWFNILLLGLTLYWSGTKPAASTFSPMIRRPTFIERLCVAS